MKIRAWTPGMSDKATADLAYWERNCLALHYADGWYNDDTWHKETLDGHIVREFPMPRFTGWRRVLSLENGTITFHISDDFDVGLLPEIKPNWDGHTTEQKWGRILARRGVGGL